MKRIQHISSKVQVAIVRDYRERNPGSMFNTFRWSLPEIAKRYEVSVSTVNKLAAMAGCQGRSRGGRYHEVPDVRTMKILRDATEPFITMEEVGRRNPIVRVNRRTGMRKEIPLTRQRVSKIIKRWRERFDELTIHGRGFNPGDKIEWANQYYIVARYDNSHRGAAIDLSDSKLIDPFCWVYKTNRSRLITPVESPMTTKEVLNKYLGRDHVNLDAQSVAGAPNQ